MKKIVTLLSISGVLVLAGCVAVPMDQPGYYQPQAAAAQSLYYDSIPVTPTYVDPVPVASVYVPPAAVATPIISTSIHFGGRYHRRPHHNRPHHKPHRPPHHGHRPPSHRPPHHGHRPPHHGHRPSAKPHK